MRHNIINVILSAVLIILTLGGLSGCNDGGGGDGAPVKTHDPNRPSSEVPNPAETAPVAIPEIPIATAPGINVEENDRASIDYSNTRDGYVMVKHQGITDKAIRVLLSTPDGTQYQYRLIPGGDYEVLPLSGGDGEYSVAVYEQIEGTRFALELSLMLDVRMENEFVPFLRPNNHVQYDQNSKAVRKAAELTAGIPDVMGKIAAVYRFVTTNINYDTELAETVQSGYLPDVDEVLVTGMGICFDYAALMTAMLRSQGIPTQMVFGYTGNAYHAWINVYTVETGWIDNVISFDGNKWEFMDPTFAASVAQDVDLSEFIGDGSKYQAKYLY